MTPPMATGITLTRPSALKEFGRTLLGDLFQPLGKFLSASTLGPFAGVGVAAVDLVAKFRPDETTEEATWRLVWLALLDAVEDLADAVRFPSTTAKDSIDTEHLVQLGGAEVDLDQIEVPWVFLQRPGDLPLLPVIAGNLEAALVYLGTEPHVAQAATARLRARFGAFFYKRAMQQRDRLDQLRDLLKSEPATALRQSLNWQAYREHLEFELNERLFSENGSLRQLYQPLRGHWIERLESEHGRPRERHHVIDLAEAFDGWLEPFAEGDALRVVAGGPGSGKSSFVKWWAVEVMQREPMLPALLVPLHYLKTLDLEREVGEYAKLHGFPANPLDTDEGERRLLLVLDGLDELDADQKRGRDAAAALVTAVHKLLLKNEHGFRIQVVLAGRALIVESLQGELNRERQIYHVLGYAPRKADEEWNDPGGLLKSDQRQKWWRCWGSLSGEGLAGLPAEIGRNQNLADLADQPLLNHLLAITRAANPAALDASSSVNSVYASLLRHVWERSWGEKRQIADVKPLTVEQFNRLFESIGLAVWQHGGGRSTTLADVAEVATLEKLDKLLPAFKEGAEQGALALLTAFFFRRAGSDETFELTHKTFGEYLAARRLARLVEDLHRLLPAGDIGDCEGLRCWYRLTWAARVTPEIMGFLEKELGALGLEDVQARRQTLIRLFDVNLASGMPFQGVDGHGQPRTYREAERFTAAAELALFATIGVCSRVIVGTIAETEPNARRELVRWSPAWPDSEIAPRDSAWDLLRRLEAGNGRERPARKYLPSLALEHQILRVDLSRSDLRCADLRGADLCGANLSRAALNDAALSDADLRGANLSRANLSCADLSDADLRGANFSRANLSCADLSDADFRRAYVNRANLSRANLSRANFSDIDLGATNLSHADFSQTDLSGADLGVGLLSAVLCGARNITRRQLECARQVDWDSVPENLFDD